jgi:HPt (histidine-containing phosphotransfer) domain-containing protein
MDTRAFLDLSDGNPDKCRELIELYLTKTAENFDEVEKAIRANASSQVARIAHSMIGANLMVGLNTQVPMLRTLELHGSRDNLKAAGLTLVSLRQEFEAIRAELEAAIQL